MALYKVGDLMRVKEAYYHSFKEGTLVRINGGLDGCIYDCKCVDERVSPAQQLVMAWDLTPITMQPQKIVIATDGKTTTATLYEGKQHKADAKAVCSPEDTFDLATGAKLALDRLLGAETEKPKLFPIEDIKAGYLLEVRDKRGETYYATVTYGYCEPLRNGKAEVGLICCCKDKHWHPLCNFSPDLTNGYKKIMAVYGYTTPMYSMDNSPQSRELLWRRGE